MIINWLIETPPSNWLDVGESAMHGWELAACLLLLLGFIAWGWWQLGKD